MSYLYILSSKSMHKLEWRLVYTFYSHKWCETRWGAVPRLFNVYLNELLSKLRENGLGCHMNGQFVGTFIYADDITILAPSHSSLQSRLTILVYRPGYFTVHPPPAPSGPKFSNSENCCGSENAMPPKIFWDMEGHRGHFRSKNVFFFQKHILKKIHNKSNYF